MHVQRTTPGLLAEACQPGGLRHTHSASFPDADARSLANGKGQGKGKGKGRKARQGAAAARSMGGGGGGGGDGAQLDGAHSVVAEVAPYVLSWYACSMVTLFMNKHWLEAEADGGMGGSTSMLGMAQMLMGLVTGAFNYYREGAGAHSATQLRTAPRPRPACARLGCRHAMRRAPGKEGTHPRGPPCCFPVWCMGPVHWRVGVVFWKLTELSVLAASLHRAAVSRRGRGKP